MLKKKSIINPPINREYSMVWRWIQNLHQRWDRIFFIYSWVCSTANIEKPCLTEWNNFHIQSQKHWVFCLIHFLWFLNTFLSNLTESKQYMTWCHNCFWFSHCEKKLLIFSKCEHNNLWKYLYHSMDKIWKCNKMVFWLKLKTLPLKEMIFKI